MRHTDEQIWEKAELKIPTHSTHTNFNLF